MTPPEDYAIDEVRTLIGEYEQFLSGKAEGTREAYLRTVRQLIGWVAQLQGKIPNEEIRSRIDEAT